MTQIATDRLRTLASSGAIPNDSVVPRYVAERKLRLSIARVNNRLYAFEDLCTCSEEPCPLSGGLLRGTTLMCQCHGSQFDISSGAVIKGPAVKRLNLFEVQEVDGDVRVRA